MTDEDAAKLLPTRSQSAAVHPDPMCSTSRVGHAKTRAKTHTRDLLMK